jgi:hypothetical protein
MNWANRHKRKVEAAKKAREIEEMEAAEAKSAQADYSAGIVCSHQRFHHIIIIRPSKFLFCMFIFGILADLKGLRVIHDMDDIKDDILVLADKRITGDGTFPLFIYTISKRSSSFSSKLFK